MKKSLKEKFAFWLLKKRFTTCIYLMFDKTGSYFLSVRKSHRRDYTRISVTMAYEICLAHSIPLDLKPGEERLIARTVAAV